MSETNEKPKATAETTEKKEQPAPKDTKDKSTAGTEKEKTVWEKAAETIAGDNKLMESVLKIVLSPITLVAGAGVIIFCFFKIKGLNDDVEKLKAENKKLNNEKIIQEEEYHKIKKKRDKLKEQIEVMQGNNMGGFGFTQHELISSDTPKKKTYNTAFLD
jgi:cell division protein FtsB